MPWCGTIDATFSVRQLQEKFLEKNKYFKFVEKGFLQCSLQKALLPMRKLGIDEWIIQLVQETFLPAITCSKLTIETLEQGVKYVQS